MATSNTVLTAVDIMTPEPICIEPSATLRELARTFAEYDISGVPVVDANGRTIGIVSKTDLIRRCVDGLDDLAPAYLFEALAEHGSEAGEMEPEPPVRVEDFMVPDPVTVTRETPVHDIARQMCERRIHRVIVVSSSQAPVGIVTSLDVLRALTPSTQEGASAP